MALSRSVAFVLFSGLLVAGLYSLTEAKRERKIPAVFKEFLDRKLSKDETEGKKARVLPSIYNKLKERKSSKDATAAKKERKISSIVDKFLEKQSEKKEKVLSSIFENFLDGKSRENGSILGSILDNFLDGKSSKKNKVQNLVGGKSSKKGKLLGSIIDNLRGGKLKGARGQNIINPFKLIGDAIELVFKLVTFPIRVPLRLIFDIIYTVGLLLVGCKVVPVLDCPSRLLETLPFMMDLIQEELGIDLDQTIELTG